MPTAERPVRTKLWPLLWIAVVCAAGAIVALLVTYFSAQDGTGQHLFVAYAGGVAAIVATGFVLAVLGNRVFRALA